jgi:hypothetical protein
MEGMCHIITGDKNRPVVKVLFPLHTFIFGHNQLNFEAFFQGFLGLITLVNTFLPNLFLSEYF